MLDLVWWHHHIPGSRTWSFNACRVPEQHGHSSSEAKHNSAFRWRASQHRPLSNFYFLCGCCSPAFKNEGLAIRQEIPILADKTEISPKFAMRTELKDGFVCEIVRREHYTHSLVPHMRTTFINGRPALFCRSAHWLIQVLSLFHSAKLQDEKKHTLNHDDLRNTTENSQIETWKVGGYWNFDGLPLLAEAGGRPGESNSCLFSILLT